MTCRACGFDHPPMQDCKVAARLRANAVTDKPKTVVTHAAAVTQTLAAAVTVAPTVTAELHPNVTAFTDLSMHLIKWPQPAAERMRRYRARKASVHAQD
jgi:hypothetical protein